METDGGSQQTEPSISSITREGLVGGVVGAAALAIWFLIIDTLAGRPLYTPAILGARMFQGAVADQFTGMPEPAAALIAGYTLVHGLAFVIAGWMIAAALSIFERTPPLMIPGFFFLVVFFELGYYAYILAFVEPVFGAVNWPAMVIGNFLAIAGMAGYFRRRHPDLHRKLLRE